jgi:hypothetical protein
MRLTQINLLAARFQAMDPGLLPEFVSHQIDLQFTPGFSVNSSMQLG